MPNQIKALLILNDTNSKDVGLTSNVPIYKSNCYTVQHFDYQYFRDLNNKGIPYGPTRYTTMLITIKSLPDSVSAHFYERLKEDSDYNYSIIFNAGFVYDKLVYYESAITVSGYLTEIKEKFISSNEYDKSDEEEKAYPLINARPSNEQEKYNQGMLMELTLTLKSITYTGTDSSQNKELILSK